MEQKKWHVAKTNGTQGLIIEDGTGRNVAVSYDVKDAKLIAEAPRMFELLKTLTDILMGSDSVSEIESLKLESWSIISEIGEEDEQ